MLFDEYSQLAVVYRLPKGGHCGILAYYGNACISKNDGNESATNFGSLSVFLHSCNIQSKLRHGISNRRDCLRGNFYANRHHSETLNPGDFLRVR